MLRREATDVVSIDHVRLHELRSDLALRPLSPAEIRAVLELVGDGEISTKDMVVLGAYHRLRRLGLARASERPTRGAGGPEHTIVPSCFLIELDKARLLLPEIGVA